MSGHRFQPVGGSEILPADRRALARVLGGSVPTPTSTVVLGVLGTGGGHRLPPALFSSLVGRGALGPTQRYGMASPL